MQEQVDWLAMEDQGNWAQQPWLSMALFPALATERSLQPLVPIAQNKGAGFRLSMSYKDEDLHDVIDDLNIIAENRGLPPIAPQ